MKFLPEELYCMDCRETVREDKAKTFPGENGLYCPECEDRLHRIVLLEDYTRSDYCEQLEEGRDS